MILWNTGDDQNGEIIIWIRLKKSLKEKAVKEKEEKEAEEESGEKKKEID